MYGIVYMYRNLTNEKKYIGQTNNLARRIKEHRAVAFAPSKSNYRYYFHQALRKHTEKQFEVSVLWEGETTRKQLSAMEQDFIKEYRSHVSQWGYNLTWGGDGVSKESIHTDNIKEIKEKIREGTSYAKISEEFGCSPAFISSVNHGLRFYDSEEIYPINSFHYFNADDKYPFITELLQDPRYSFKDIAALAKCSYATVKSYNAGRLQKGKYWKGKYPIRDRYFTTRPRWYQALNLLVNTKIPIRTIGREICHLTDTTVSKINRGELIPQENIIYPIRQHNSCKNNVSTIPGETGSTELFK